MYKFGINLTSGVEALLSSSILQIPKAWARFFSLSQTKVLNLPSFDAQETCTMLKLYVLNSKYLEIRTELHIIRSYISS